MEFKKGDKIVCKKEIVFYGVEYYAVGDTATIINIWNENYYKSIFLTCKVKNSHGGYEFGLKPEQLKKHFYTLKEYRLKKLQHLNNLPGNSLTC